MPEALFLQVLNMSFTASVVILFVLLARLLLKKAPKLFSYALWSVALFRLICPFSFESVISLLPTKASPIPSDIMYAQIPQIDTGLPSINQGVNAILPAATPYASINPMQVWIFVGCCVWLIGIAALLIYSVLSLVKLRRRLGDAVHEQDAVYTSASLASPFVMGLFRPKIYLPASLTPTEKTYILLHEQTHIKRLDHVVKMLSFFVLCLHWFNPLVWVAFFFSGRDMELSCDESVIKQLGREVKKDYSSSLLTLATGRRIVGGTPLAFGEGDTKRRIKNVLNYKKPAFWVVIVSAIAVVAVVVGLLANPKEKAAGFGGVNALVLEINQDTPSMTVMGLDENSVIGGRCVITWQDDALISVVMNSGPKQLTIDDFAVGDYVTLFIGEVQESEPTRAHATTIQLQPKEALSGVYAADLLWNARTPYIGNNAAVGKLIELLPIPAGLQYDHFELQTTSRPYTVEIIYSVSTELLRAYESEDAGMADPLRKNAIVLLALIDNADEISATLTDGSRKSGFINGREWADYTVNGDVRDSAENPEALEALIAFMDTGAGATPPAAAHSITRLGKGEEVLAHDSLQKQELAQAIIMDASMKSAAWEGVDITTLDECYLIRQSFPEEPQPHDYYAYRITDTNAGLPSGTAVLQDGVNGRYSALSDDLYEALAKYASSAPVGGEEAPVQNAKYSQSITQQERTQTEDVARNYFTKEAPYYEGIVSIAPAPDDYHLYQNTGIEAEYDAGNIIIYKVLTGRDQKDHYPERFVSVARSSKDADWEVINQGY